MDRLIRTAWRAFWVGLGASAVLVTQSLVAPSQPSAPPPSAAEPALVTPPSPPPAAARTPKTTDPVLSKIPRCETIANTVRCS